MSPLHPLDWNFSSCPPDEIPFLYHYEFSRECPVLRSEVEFLRHGEISQPSYWLPIRNFGRTAWPNAPYLSIPSEKRQKRLIELLNPDDLHDVIQATVDLPFDILPSERDKAIVQYMRREYAEPPKAEGRRSATARYRDRLRALAVFRLRQHHSSRETLSILRTEYRRSIYSNTTSLEKAHRRARRYIVEFDFLAQESISNGRWFPPFGKYLIIS